MTQKNHADLQSRLIGEVSIADLITYFGVTELLDNIGVEAVKAYLESELAELQVDANDMDSE